MSSQRAEYFQDLLKDCFDAVERANIPEDDEAVVVAALIFSDSLNGLRKALLTPHYMMVDRAAREKTSS